MVFSIATAVTVWAAPAPAKVVEARFDAKVFFISSNTEAPETPGKQPFARIWNVFGYVKPSAGAGNTNPTLSVVYLWLPAPVEEVGIRLFSPWKREYGTPDKKSDLILAPWSEAERDTARFFDPFLRFERATAFEPGQLTPEGMDRVSWLWFGENDDSAELPPGPSGSRHQALLRYPSQGGDPLKGLGRGLYRILWGAEKGGAVQGSFLLQVAVQPKVAGVVLGTDLPSLQSNLSTAEPRKK